MLNFKTDSDALNTFRREYFRHMKKLKSIFWSAVILVFTTGTLFGRPLPIVTHHSIIIDTDCAIDDFRAINLLLSRPEISIRAILVSDGSLPPEDGIKKVRSLLHAYHCDTIPVACGRKLDGEIPPWQAFNKGISWGEPMNSSCDNEAVDLLANILKNSGEKIEMVCLGPLTTLADLKREKPDLLQKIERIIWYNESIKPLSGFNYTFDKQAFSEVKSTETRMDVVSDLDYPGAVFDTSLYNLGRRSNTQLAREIAFIHEQKPVHEKLLQQHFKLCDELAAIYLCNPELFDMDTDLKQVWMRSDVSYDLVAVREAMSDMIKGDYVPERNIVFNKFPDNREQFTYDVRQIMDTVIGLYGKEEWKACVMTDEFHGHLGVYSIVGAKMGIKARELFNVGPDQLDAETFAGSVPPYSCLNDGIQVSTGATVGMGTIHVSSDSITVPSAIFTYRGKSIKITLRPEYVKEVDDDIKDGILKFGLMDDGYWKLVRRNAIKYWVNWDRNKIFDIEVLTNKE